MINLALNLMLGARAASGAVVPLIEPSSQWDGTAGTGFGGDNPAAPTDPSRTTAKPALRLLVPPNQHFTDTLDVGVIAAANDGGSLANTLGIASVTFHYEGNSVTVDAPSWHTIQTVKGARTYFGWWVTLKKPASTAGKANLYIEATARDATMQKRVMGPYLFSPVDNLYDGQLTVAPSLDPIVGQRYQTILAAGTYAKSQGWHNWLCTITEAGRYDIGDDLGTSHWFQTGYCNITASVPGVVIGKPAADPLVPATNMFSNRMKLHIIGPNIKLDRRWLARLLAVTAPNVADHWFDGIDITTTAPDGRNELLAGAPRNPSEMFSGNPWFTECHFEQVYAASVGANVLRGCTGDQIGMDIASAGRCVVQSTFTNHNDDFWNSDVPAISVQYSGAEATATLARSGGTQGFGGGVYTCTIGATAHTFNVGNAGNTPSQVGTTIQGYWFDDVVTWLNTLPDVTATLLLSANQRAANTGTLTGRKGQGFAATDIKAAPLTVTSYYDKHGDFYQHETGTLENVIVFGNLLDEAQVQCIFLSPDSGGAAVATRDAVFIGNIFNTEKVPAPGDSFDPATAASQIGRPNHTCSHVVIAQNSFVDQRWLIRTDGSNNTVMDAYCLWSNNVTPSFDITGSDTNIAMTMKNSRLYDGATVEPKATGFVVGGDKTSLFVDEANSDYRPTGALLTSGVPPIIPFDRNANAFPVVAAVGALAAEATA